MRKGGSLIALIASIFTIIIAVGMVILSQIALMTSGQTTSADNNQAITCLLFAFAVLICSCLGFDIKRAVPGYFCLAFAAVGLILAPAVAMPFIGVSIIGSVFMVIGGHVDRRREKRA